MLHLIENQISLFFLHEAPQITGGWNNELVAVSQATGVIFCHSAASPRPTSRLPADENTASRPLPALEAIQRLPDVMKHAQHINSGVVVTPRLQLDILLRRPR